MGSNCQGVPPCEVTLITLLTQMRKLRLREGSGSTEATHSDPVPPCGGGDICVCLVRGGGVGTARKGPLPEDLNPVSYPSLGRDERWVGTGPRALHCF